MDPANSANRGSSSGRSKYQITITTCDHCKRGFQRTGADLIEIEPAMLGAARCDADIREATNDSHDRHDAHGTHDTHVGHQDKPPRSRPIPAAIRRRVLERDQHRCQIPGCRHTLDVDVHHIVPVADGGTHDPDNLIAICSPHHRSVHAGQLHLSGKAGPALRVQHAGGSPYGAPLDTSGAQLADISEKVFRGLRWLGFKETDAKRALATALAEHTTSTDPPTADVLLKRALAFLPTA